METLICWLCCSDCGCRMSSASGCSCYEAELIFVKIRYTDANTHTHLSVFKWSYSSTKRQSWCQIIVCRCLRGCTCVTNWLLDWLSRSHSGHMTCCHSWSTNPRFGRYVYVLCALVIVFGLSVQFAAGRWVDPTFSSTSTGRINMSSFLMKAVSY